MIDPIDARALALSKCEAGWDSYNARPVDKAALERAVFLAKAARSQGHDNPCLFPVPDGGVIVDCGAIEVEVNPDGRLELFLTREVTDAEAISALKEESTMSTIIGPDGVVTRTGKRRAARRRPPSWLPFLLLGAVLGASSVFASYLAHLHCGGL